MIDDLIVLLVRYVVREWRAKHWRRASAMVLRADAIMADFKWTPVVHYTFLAGSREYVGDFSGVRVKEKEAFEAVAGIQRGACIVVRFNPRDPARNVVLNDDNRWLRFEIDEWKVAGG